jgi:aldehyde dehydrogenase (NAD+)
VDDLVISANTTMLGLVSGVWTKDLSKAHFLAKAIRAGSVSVDCFQPMNHAVPFGGQKMNGSGPKSVANTKRKTLTSRMH